MQMRHHKQMNFLYKEIYRIYLTFPWLLTIKQTASSSTVLNNPSIYKDEIQPSPDYLSAGTALQTENNNYLAQTRVMKYMDCLGPHFVPKKAIKVVTVFSTFKYSPFLLKHNGLLKKFFLIATHNSIPGPIFLWPETAPPPSRSSKKRVH